MLNVAGTDTLRAEITSLLSVGDYDGLLSIARARVGIPRTLIALSYDKSGLIAWRAMDGLGRVVAEMSNGRGRQIVQRILWMMREESGTNAWTGPELLGEIVSRRPEPFEDIAPIAVSFHDELIMRAGSLRALWRIATVRRDLFVSVHTDLIAIPIEHLTDADPSVRGYALLAIDALGLSEHAGAVAPLFNDSGTFPFYNGSELRNASIPALARRVHANLSG